MKLDYFGYQGLSPEKKKVPAALIVGKAEYLRSLVRADLLDTILGPTDRRMNLTAADASGSPRIDVTSLLDDLRTPSLLGGPRLVHLSGVEGLAKEDRPRIEEYLAHPATGAHLILEGTTLTANMRLFKAIEKMGVVIQCRPLFESPPPWQRGSGESEVARWIRLRVEGGGRRIRPSAIDALVEAWGADLASIDGAIEQASLLAGESGQISEDQIRDLAPTSRADPVYRVVDQVLAGKRPEAICGLRALFLHGMADASGRGRDNPGGVAQILIRGLAGRLMSLWRAHYLRSEGKGDKEILQTLGVAPFLARRFWEQVEANPETDIPGRLGHILEAERSIKTGLAEPMGAAEALVARL